MIDFNLTCSSPEFRSQLVASETLRGRNTEQEVEFMVELWKRLKFLRSETKRLFSSAANATLSRDEREETKARAREKECDCVLLQARLNLVADRFGNVVSKVQNYPSLRQVGLLECVAHIGTHRLMPLLSPVSVFNSTKFIDVCHLPHDFASQATRYFFDPTKHLPDVIFANFLHQVDPALVRQSVPPHRLGRSSRYSVAFLSKPLVVVARVSYESDYASRAQDFRLRKRNQTSVFPLSFLWEFFIPASHLLVAAYTPPPLTVKLAMQGGNVETVWDLAEDVLTRNSFLSQHASPCELDQQVHGFLLQTRGSMPRVQYPCVHRWMRCLEANGKGFACSVLSCLCLI